MRRSHQLLDLIRLVRLKLIERKKLDCYWARAFDKSAQLVQMTSDFAHIGALWFHSQINSPFTCWIYLKDTRRNCSCITNIFLARRLSTTGPILVSWFWTFLCSVPFALHAVILSSARLWVNATLVAYFTAHAKCFCVTQTPLKI